MSERTHATHGEAEELVLWKCLDHPTRDTTMSLPVFEKSVGRDYRSGCWGCRLAWSAGDEENFAVGIRDFGIRSGWRNYHFLGTTRKTEPSAMPSHARVAGTVSSFRKL